MVQAHDGGGSGRPSLPGAAGPQERALYEIYDFQSGTVAYTASQWATTAEELTDLAASVRKVVSDLRRAPDGGEAWSGAAADAAYESLGRLATNLDRHAEDVTNIEGGLVAAGDAVTDARIAYATRVRTVDIDIEPSGYMTTTPPPPVGPPVPPRLDQGAYDQAVSAARAQREAEAASVMQTYENRMESAAKKLPVEPAESPVSDGRYPSGGGGGGDYPGGGSTPGGGTWTPPGGGGAGTGRDPVPPQVQPTGGGRDGDGGTTWFPPRDTEQPDPVVLDGSGTGTLGPGGGGSGPLPGTTGPGAAPGGGLGAGGAAFGMGGMLAGGGAAALMGRGGPGGPGGLGAAGRGGAGASGRGGVVGVGTTGGAAGRGSGSGAAGRGGTAGSPRSSVVAGGGGQAAAGRGGAGRGGGRAAGRTGRYGVPTLGARGGRAGGTGVAGAAGSRTGKHDEGEGPDVDHLTHEDEETWFEGAEQASPPVWE